MRRDLPDPYVERLERDCRGLLADGTRAFPLHELQPHTQLVQDNARRRSLGKPEMPVDERFLAGLVAGLPDCSGVALGLDRLLMLKCGASDISEVLAFPAERA